MSHEVHYVLRARVYKYGIQIRHVRIFHYGNSASYQIAKTIPLFSP